MRKYYKNWKRIFLAPDTGGGSGGGSQQQTGNPAAGQAGGHQQQDSSTTFKDPTADIDLDDLTPEVRAVIEKSRAGFASLQKQATDAEAARITEEGRRKDFQSNYDKLRSQVESLNAGGNNNVVDPNAVQLQKMMKTLTGRGVPEPQARVQAEMMMEMLGDFGAELKNQIGKDLSPFASTIVSREAELSWQQVVATDKTGALQIPELAQHVWDQVDTMAKNGQQVTPQIVQNLTGMAYFAHLQNGGGAAVSGNNNNPPVQQQQQQQLPNVGRLTYPGAGALASRPPQHDANAARTVLDPATDAALQVVLGKWANGQGGVKAPGLRQPTKGR